MTETAFTRKFMAKLRAAAMTMPYTIIIFKHNDFYTAGIPDFSVSVKELGITSWFEIKMAGNNPTKLQQYYLDRLPRAHVIIARPPIYFLDNNPSNSIGFLIEDVLRASIT